MGNEIVLRPFYSIKPNNSWYELVKERGMPTRKARWCNKWKMEAKKNLQSFLRSRGEKLISYIGFCADEVNRFKNDGNIYPLAEENIIEKDILEWAKTEPIFNDYYKYNTRCGCMFCPMASMTNLAYLYKYYPTEYSFFMSECKRTEEMREKELGRPFSVFQSKPKYNSEYYDRIVRTKYAKRLEVIDIG